MRAAFRFERPLASVARLEPDGTETPLDPDGAVFGDALGEFGAAVYRITFR